VTSTDVSGHFAATATATEYAMSCDPSTDPLAEDGMNQELLSGSSATLEQFLVAT
jgi:hypothetical protein